jgi:hypothetical protein
MLIRVTPLTPDEEQQLITKSGGPQFSPSARFIPVRIAGTKQLVHVTKADIWKEEESR